MNPRVFLIFSLLLVGYETTIANHLVAVRGREDNIVMKKCLDKEKHALLHFEVGLQDPHGCLSTWRAEEDDCCKWFGVTCHNQTGFVKELEIRECDLVGEISHSLVNLSYLTHLNLSSNSFHGTIPTFIGFLTRLRYLDLGWNQFSGIIPKSIGSLTELRYLDLSYNSLHGTIPLEFGNLVKLQAVFLRSIGRCRVENLEWLSPLSNLEEFRMDKISLAKQNYWVDVILGLRKLSILSLRGCELSKVMYPYSSFLNSSSSIHTLYLSYNNLNSSMYRWLFALTSNKLRFLSLSSNMLDGIPKYLGNLCNLQTLQLYNNSAVVKFPDFLNNLSGCASLTLKELYAPGSQFTESLSDEIQKFSSLEELILFGNQLNGTISEKLWELPRSVILDLRNNYLKGAISENIGKSKANGIYLSKNSLEGVPSTDHMSSHSYVEEIDMSSCNLGPHFPKWIQTLKNLTYLNIANISISDAVPLEFWHTWPSRLQYLNLSSNNISGKVPDLSSNFNDSSMLDLSFNNFYGPIPSVSPTLSSLNLSRNKFYGGISFLCQMVDGFLEFLDLSNNLLTGQLPDCLWHFKELKVLNLGNNNLYGRLPTSFGSLTQLEALYLYKNDFSGELPLSIKNCTMLNFLNLGANKLSGNVPIWIGENLSRLYVLILTSNDFFGTIPFQLCQLAALQILDLSMNHLHGIIPSCFNNITSLVQEGPLPTQNEHSFSVPQQNYGHYRYSDHAMIQWQGDGREFIRSNLGLLKSIDLSSNNLTGKIPWELTNLHGMLALNLSNNALLGEIPWQIGEMKKLLALDLCRNSLSGSIPSGMSQMTLLSYLDVSSNNLIGRIPSSTQLQSFEPSRYDGNAGLCGPPLTKKCHGDEESDVPPIIGESEGDGEGIDELERWFYIGGATGFSTGFWIACGGLLLNHRGRRAFFEIYDSFKDWIYVKVVVFIAGLERVAPM